MRAIEVNICLTMYLSIPLCAGLDPVSIKLNGRPTNISDLYRRRKVGRIVRRAILSLTPPGAISGILELAWSFPKEEMTRIRTTILISDGERGDPWCFQCPGAERCISQPLAVEAEIDSRPGMLGIFVIRG